MVTASNGTDQASAKRCSGPSGVPAGLTTRTAAMGVCSKHEASDTWASGRQLASRAYSSRSGGGELMAARRCGGRGGRPAP